MLFELWNIGVTPIRSISVSVSLMNELDPCKETLEVIRFFSLAWLNWF